MSLLFSQFYDYFGTRFCGWLAFVISSPHLKALLLNPARCPDILEDIKMQKGRSKHGNSRYFPGLHLSRCLDGFMIRWINYTKMVFILFWQRRARPGDKNIRVLRVELGTQSLHFIVEWIQSLRKEIQDSHLIELEQLQKTAKAFRF